MWKNRLWKNISKTELRGKNTVNYLFHNYYLVQSELPHLRKMHGKAPVDTPWKIPLPGHESSHESQHQAHLEHQLMQEQRRQTAPQRRTQGGMSFPEAHIKAATWHLRAMCQPQMAGKARVWHMGSGSRGNGWGAMAALLQEERKVCCGGVLAVVSTSVSQDLLHPCL